MAEKEQTHEKNWQARGSDLDHIDWIEKSIADQWQGLRLLDLGCGSGYVCATAMEKGANLAVGIDISDPENMPQYDNDAWTFLHIDLDFDKWNMSLVEKTGLVKFDLILAFDIIEHLESPYRFLTSCRRLIAKGGNLILTTPNTGSWERMVKPSSWSGIMDPQHKTLFSIHSLEFILRRCGFTPKQTKAPLRSLGMLGPIQPQIGGQIFSVSSPGALPL